MPLKKSSAAPASRQVGGDVSIGNQSISVAKDFVSTSYGPPWGGIQGSGVTADGTNLRNNPEIYGVAVDPNVVPLGTDLYIWPNPFGHKGSFKAFDTGGAIKGNRIDFYDWRGRAQQNGWGRRTVKVSFSSSSGSAYTPHVGNPIKWVDEAAKNIVAFIKIMVDPVQLGEHLAKVLIWLLKMYYKAFYNVIILPPWRWTQRSTIYYYENFLLGSNRRDTGVKAIATMSFWAVGYAILWGKFEPTEVGVDARDSALATTLGAGRDALVARRITKPKDVEKHTAKKPEPATTTVPLEVTRTLAANRRRSVKVTDNRGKDIAEQERTPNGRGRNDTAAQNTAEVVE